MKFFISDDFKNLFKDISEMKSSSKISTLDAEVQQSSQEIKVEHKSSKLSIRPKSAEKADPVSLELYQHQNDFGI